MCTVTDDSSYSVIKQTFKKQLNLQKRHRHFSSKPVTGLWNAFMYLSHFVSYSCSLDLFRGLKAYMTMYVTSCLLTMTWFPQLANPMAISNSTIVQYFFMNTRVYRPLSYKNPWKNTRKLQTVIAKYHIISA